MIRQERASARKAYEEALAGGTPLRLAVGRDGHLQPVNQEHDPGATEPAIQPSPGVEELETDPLVLSLVRENRQLLEELRGRPYLDLTVWGPFTGWRGVVLCVAILGTLVLAVVGTSLNL